MKCNYLHYTFAACVFLIASNASLSESSTPLELNDVLASTQSFLPQVLQSIADVRSTQTGLQETAGAFDLIFTTDTFHKVTGFYDGQSVSAGIKKPLRTLGATVYGNYQVSEGNFPLYEDEYFTNTGGRAKVGVLVSLLRNRDIDAERLAEKNAALTLNQAEFDLFLTRINAQQLATIAYWQWVVAGERLTILEELLSIAENREQGLQEQVAQGAVARIFLVENQQNITQRRVQVANATRDYLQTSNALSLYWRDSEGKPRLPNTEQRPNKIVTPPAFSSENTFSVDELDELLQRRPEIALLENAMAQANNQIQFMQNNVQPTLNLSVEVGEPFGRIDEGGLSRDTTDTRIGLNFSVPIGQRQARAKLAKSRIQREKLNIKRQQALETITLDMQDLLLELNYANTLMNYAEVDIKQSEQLQRAEQQRFNNGASDFFLLNVREQAVANAKIRAAAARLDMHVAYTNYYASTLNLNKLGLNDYSQPLFDNTHSN